MLVTAEMGVWTWLFAESLAAGADWVCRRATSSAALDHSGSSSFAAQIESIQWTVTIPVFPLAKTFYANRLPFFRSAKRQDLPPPTNLVLAAYGHDPTPRLRSPETFSLTACSLLPRDSLKPSLAQEESPLAAFKQSADWSSTSSKLGTKGEAVCRHFQR